MLAYDQSNITGTHTPTIVIGQTLVSSRWGEERNLQGEQKDRALKCNVPDPFFHPISGESQEAPTTQDSQWAPPDSFSRMCMETLTFPSICPKAAYGCYRGNQSPTSPGDQTHPCIIRTTATYYYFSPALGGPLLLASIPPVLKADSGGVSQ